MHTIFTIESVPRPFLRFLMHPFPPPGGDDTLIFKYTNSYITNEPILFPTPEYCGCTRCGAASGAPSVELPPVDCTSRDQHTPNYLPAFQEPQRLALPSHTS